MNKFMMNEFLSNKLLLNKLSLTNSCPTNKTIVPLHPMGPLVSFEKNEVLQKWSQSHYNSWSIFIFDQLSIGQMQFGRMSRRHIIFYVKIILIGVTMKHVSLERAMLHYCMICLVGLEPW